MRLNRGRLILVATMCSVVAAAAFTAVVSYSHFYALGRAHGQDGTAARLLPLSVDLLILAASLTLLWAASNRQAAPWPIRAVLVAFVAVTIAGNAVYAIGDGPVGVVLSSLPGVTFVAAIEILMWLVRAAKIAAAREIPATVPGAALPGDNVELAQLSYSATAVAGNPLSQNQLQERFGLTRAQATKVRRAAPQDAAVASSPPPGASGVTPRPLSTASANGQARGG